MSEGVKEFSELLKAVLKLCKVLTVQFKDGFQGEDLSAILVACVSDPEVLEGFKGLEKLPKEFLDFSLTEGFELAGVIIKGIPEIIEAAKKA